MIKNNFDITPYINQSEVLYDGKIVKFIVPDTIFDECLHMVDHCRKFKDSECADLHYLQNVGSNGYQIFIPNFLIEDSFLLPYLHMISSHVSNAPIKMRVAKTYYGAPIYDVWINYCYKGDINQSHVHEGIYSAILFMANDDTPTSFDDGKFEYVGKQKELLFFSSQQQHCVNEKQSDVERVTIALNMDLISDEKT